MCGVNTNGRRTRSYRFHRLNRHSASSRLHAAKQVEQQLHYSLGAAIRDRIVDLAGLSPRLDEAGLPELGQLLGKGRLLDAERLLNIADRRFLPGDLTQQHEAVCIAELPHEVRCFRRLGDHRLQRYAGFPAHARFSRKYHASPSRRSSPSI
ncbi:hypothetical protein D9M69_631340 [compost metagenome]